jgi:membrane protein DedA with SNARE-associated domain
LYLIVFAGSLAVDLIPVVGPPAWIVMVFMQMKYDLNVWGVLACGVAGSTLGRYILGVYMPRVAHKILKRQKQDDLEFVGKKLGQSTWRCWGFVMLHTFTPLPTTTLFTAAGIAKLHPAKLLVPFVVGKTISDTMMIFAGRFTARNIEDVLHGMLSAKAVIFSVIGILAIALFLFIDWHQWIQKRKFRLRFKIWK